MFQKNAAALTWMLIGSSVRSHLILIRFQKGGWNIVVFLLHLLSLNFFFFPFFFFDF